MKWKYFPCYWPFVRGIHRTPVDSPHKDQWRGALVFSLICAWTNGSANNRDAGDLSHPHVHYDVTVIHFVKMVQTHQLKAIDIKNNAWVTVNNDFLSRVGWFGNDFHEWRSHEWKSLSNRLTSDKKSVIHGNECIISFPSRYFMSSTHKSPKNLLSTAHFAIVAKGGVFWLGIVTSPQLICDVTRRRYTGIVTSYSSIVMARANWRKGDLY